MNIDSMRDTSEPPASSLAALDLVTVTVGDMRRMKMRRGEGLEGELAAVKAALLYADNTTLFSLRLHLDALGDDGPSASGISRESPDWEEHLAAWHANGRNVFSVLDDASVHEFWVRPGGWDELKLAVDAGLLKITDMSWT